jgi:hypothetical protein
MECLVSCPLGYLGDGEKHKNTTKPRTVSLLAFLLTSRCMHQRCNSLYLATIVLSDAFIFGVSPRSAALPSKMGDSHQEFTVSCIPHGDGLLGTGKRRPSGKTVGLGR